MSWTRALLLTSSPDNQLGCGSHTKAPVCSDGRVPCQQEVRGALVWREGGRWLGGGDLGASLSLGTFLGTSDYSLGKQYMRATLMAVGSTAGLSRGHQTASSQDTLQACLAILPGTLLWEVIPGEQSPQLLGALDPGFLKPDLTQPPSSSRRVFLPGKCIPERPLAALLTLQPSSVCSPSGPRGLCEHHKVESMAQPPSERGELWSSAPDQSAISLPSVVTSLKHPEESGVAGSSALFAQQPRPHW